MIRRWVLVAAGVSVVAFGAQVTPPALFRTGPPPVAGNCVEWAGINSIKDAGFPCGGGSLTPCTAGSVDLSLTTGCNIPFYVGGIFP